MKRFTFSGIAGIVIMRDQSKDQLWMMVRKDSRGIQIFIFHKPFQNMGLESSQAKVIVDILLIC